MSTKDCVIGYFAVDLYLGRCGREWAIDFYLGRCGRICTGDVVVGNGSIDIY